MLCSLYYEREGLIRLARGAGNQPAGDTSDPITVHNQKGYISLVSHRKLENSCQARVTPWLARLVERP